ncbi:MAG: hypothetical protein A2092_16690 [Rhodobacteraceae bacterium GWE1_64_9]|jgi:TPR repeat protein|nr:MAG: hypothetical protein A2092_16690 [Rhodobacteraceae bacterium GWE1_64_9]OHC47495.1 MAG: hypothetical protein A2X69_04800 [Rhodobacteraceae bacterium GWF1_65_7]
MFRSAATAALLLLPAAPLAADEFGILNPEEGGISRLAENIAVHPDRVGTLCWIAYEVQKGGGKDHVAAAEAMTLCAESGNAPSMILLAHAYENGSGVPKDPAMATGWLRRAAETGYSMGEYHYAVALAKGIGTKADPEAARHWMQRAADHGSRDAVLALSDGLTN